MINLTRQYSNQLEKCTDFCKGEEDMDWIKAWGKTFMNGLYDSFEDQIRLTNGRLDNII